MSEEIIHQPGGGETLSIVETWIKALTSPTEETYTKIAKDPGASIGKAILWIFLAGLVGAFITSLSNLVFSTPFLPLGEEYFPTEFYEPSLIGVILCTPVSAVFSVIGALVITGFCYIPARALGGTGTYEKLFYTFAAYQVPLGLVTSVLTSIPLIGCLSLFLGLYGLVLLVIATKAVMEFDWGKAVISSFVIPIIIAIVVIGCFLLFFIGIVGSVGNVFEGIIDNLNTMP
ncbi:MAG: DUF1282 domain-containing protein [Anaerolineales bacterium]|nr:MAG: DUF1282 domain-containing protein [Anaerolineales bacterium]